MDMLWYHKNMNNTCDAKTIQRKDYKSQEALHIIFNVDWMPL